MPAHMCKKFTDFIGCQKTTTPFISNPGLSKEVKKYFNKKGCDNKITIHGYICVILGLIFDNIHPEIVDNTVYKDLPSKILNHIHNNFTNDISIKNFRLCLDVTNPICRDVSTHILT